MAPMKGKRITAEERTAIEAVAYLKELLSAGKPIRVSHQLETSLPGLPAGSWVFADLRIRKSGPDIEYKGFSKPPIRY